MTADTTFIIRASRRARLYRDIEIPSSATLADLAEAIVASYNFSPDHAYGFYSKLSGKLHDSPTRFELFADMNGEGGSQSVHRTTVGDVFRRVGSAMTFLFDFGDEWRFKTEVIGIGSVGYGVGYPRIIGSVGKAPPQYAEIEDK